MQATRVEPPVPKVHGRGGRTLHIQHCTAQRREVSLQRVLLHRAPLTRLLAQQCFRQRKCREGLAAPRNLLTTSLSRSQWWFLDQSFAPVDHFLLLSQQGVSRRRLSFRLLNCSPFARFSFSLFCFCSSRNLDHAWGSDVWSFGPVSTPSPRSRRVFGNMHPSIAISERTKPPVHLIRRKAVIVLCHQVQYGIILGH